jgi:hypothetical protein
LEKTKKGINRDGQDRQDKEKAGGEAMNEKITQVECSFFYSSFYTAAFCLASLSCPSCPSLFEFSLWKTSRKEFSI